LNKYRLKLSDDDESDELGVVIVVFANTNAYFFEGSSIDVSSNNRNDSISKINKTQNSHLFFLSFEKLRKSIVKTISLRIF